MRGRKPKATALKLVSATRADRVNLREPRPLGGPLAAPPPGLTATQRQSWDHAIAHAPAGVLYKIDRSLLRAWVVADDTHRRATAEIERGLVVTTRLGKVVQNPYLTIVNQQAIILLRAAAELGFTPSSRSRLQTDGKEAPSIIDNDNANPEVEFFSD